MERLLTLDDAAQVLGVSVDTVYLLVESGQLPYVDVGSRAYKDKRATPRRNRPTMRFRDEDLQAFILARRVAATRGALVDQPPVALEARVASSPPRRRGPVLDLPGADRYMQ